METLNYLNVKVLENDVDIHSRYATISTLGAGLLGRTYRVIDVTDPGKRRYYAMKEQEKKQTFDSDQDFIRMFREVVILNRVLPKHPNIIEIKDVLVSPSKLFIVTEICKKGADFKTFCVAADNSTGRRAFRQLAEAVRTLHAHGVVHDDISGNNILFKDASFKQLKLIDFGLSKFKPSWVSAEQNSKPDVGFDHNKWFNPEEMQDVPDNLRSRDIISLGNILHSILCGKTQPFVISDEQRAMRTVFKPRTGIFDDGAMDLLCKIGPAPFRPNAAAGGEILTVDQILAHPWINREEYKLPWRPSEPLGSHLVADLKDLKNDLRLLPRLLDEWMTVRFLVVDGKQGLDRYFLAQEKVFQRGDEDSRVVNVTDTLTKSMRKEMRIIYGSITSSNNREVNGDGWVTKDPHLIYIELLIMLRILPPHDRFAEVRRLYVSENFVAMVGDRMTGFTMPYFCTHYAQNDSISRRVFKQLVETVRVMHQHGVVHINLHPQHIVWKEPSPHSEWKIVQFSKASFQPSMALLKHEKFQSLRYFTPELLQQHSAQANIQVDISALGRILHAMMAGIWVEDPAKCAGHFPRREIFDENASDLLSRIGPPPFGPLADTRTVTTEEILLHPWLQRE